MKKLPRAFRLSETAVTLLTRLAASSGINQTAVLETLIRREAQQQGCTTAPLERSDDRLGKDRD